RIFAAKLSYHAASLPNGLLTFWQIRTVPLILLLYFEAGATALQWPLCVPFDIVLGPISSRLQPASFLLPPPGFPVQPRYHPSLPALLDALGSPPLFPVLW